jgi:hypothetical protein
MNPRISFARVVGIVTIFQLATCVQAAEVTLEKHDGGVAVKVDGKPFTDYLIGNGPKPTLWPIIGPSGVEMTRAYPMRGIDGEKKDHPHQRSLWFTHGNVNGIDFWSETKGHGSIKHREFKRVEESDGKAVIVTVNDWLGPDGKKILEDERTVAFAADGATRSIDFDIVLKATDGPVTFGDTKEGTMGLRVPTVMDVAQSGGRTGGRIVNSHGQTDKEAWGKQAPWVDYHGTVDGRMVGVAILNHPSSFRFPTYWHVRDYGLFAANPFGLHDFQGSDKVNGDATLKPGETMQLRYRFVFHDGDEKSGKVAEAFEAYAKESKD